jgi:hypothetical protein
MNRTCLHHSYWVHQERASGITRTWLWNSVKMRNSYCTISSTRTYWAYTKHPVASVLTFYPIPNWFYLHRYHRIRSLWVTFNWTLPGRVRLGHLNKIDSWRYPPTRWRCIVRKATLTRSDSNIVDADFFQKFANLENIAPLIEYSDRWAWIQFKRRTWLIPIGYQW